MGHIFEPGGAAEQWALGEINRTQEALRAPHLLYKCEIFKVIHGAHVGQWLCHHEMSKVVGVGATPQEACAAFDRAWFAP